MSKDALASGRRGHTWLVIPLLGALSAFGPLSIDMYLPSFPRLAAEFGATPGQVQLTLSAFFLGFALGQLLYGPLSDRYGRKPLLMVGLSVYVVTSLLCMMSPRIEILSGLRFLQALGGGAGAVIARAMVRDLYDRDLSARVLSLMMLVTALAPLVAPLIGGYLLHWSGWRAIFGLLCMLGFACLVAVVRYLPESHAPSQRRRGALAQVMREYGAVFSHRQALGAILAGGVAFAGMFAYISGTPFIYMQLFGVAPEHYGYWFGLNVVGLMLGASLSGKLVPRVGAQSMLGIGTSIAALAGLSLLITAWTGVGGFPGIVVPLFVYVGSLNLISANAAARALDYFPKTAGTTSAVFGAVQFGLGALAGALVGQLHDGSAVPMAAVVAVAGVLSWSTRYLSIRQPNGDWRYSIMLNRALKAVLLLLVVSGLVSSIISVSPGGTKAPPGSIGLSLGTIAYAQNPGAPLRYRVVAEQSEARYRIREQLAGFNLPNDAVGATNTIEGSIVLDGQGRPLTDDSRLTVDLRKLQSDRDRRDNYVRRNTLETERYPLTVFVPTEIRGLQFPFPQSGTASFELIGDLTVRDVTRRVTWEATATFNGPDVNVQAKTAFRFADFDLTIPRVSSVLSVEDNIRLETDLLLRHSS
jgi:DHA1 family bicyclomycin/chloramphenicol resistance-like MFS transporter